MQRFGLNIGRLQHKVMYKNNRAEGDENIFAEKQLDVICHRRHGAQAMPHNSP